VGYFVSGNSGGEPELVMSFCPESIYQWAVGRWVREPAEIIR